MNANMIILSSLCLLFLLFSAFFSAAEMALFSIPRERIDTFKGHASRSRRLIYSLLLDGQRTLLLILLGNLFVNFTLAGLINSLMAGILGYRATFWTFLIATAVIVAFGEVLPKNWALSRNERIAAFASPILYGFKRVTSPLLDMMQGISRFFLDIFKVHLRQPLPFITMDELQSAVRSSCERGDISRSEQGVISNLLDRGAQPVKRFMIHRSAIPFLPHYTAASAALKALSDAGRTFALVTKGPRSQQVMGVVYLQQLLGARADVRCRTLASAPHWAPETLEAADLISFMFAEKLSVVCVLDEFGGVSGAFSLAEGLDKVMNVRSERGERGREAGAKHFRGLEEVEGMTEWLPPELLSAGDGARTLNGLLTRYLGRIPRTGERFDIGARHFYITHSSPNKIESVMIR